MLPMDVIFYPLIQGQTESKLEQKWIQGKMEKLDLIYPKSKDFGPELKSRSTRFAFGLQRCESRARIGHKAIALGSQKGIIIPELESMLFVPLYNKWVVHLYLGLWEGKKCTIREEKGPPCFSASGAVSIKAPWMHLDWEQSISISMNTYL